jgi:lysyl-tRNA synthetase class 1
MYKRISGTRTLSVEDIPQYMDEYDALEDCYFGKTKENNPAILRKNRGLYEYINHLNPPERSGIHSPYRLIVQLAKVAPEDNFIEYIIEKLKIYRIIKEADKGFINKIKLSHKWSIDFKVSDNEMLELSSSERKAIRTLLDHIEESSTPENIQNEIFEASKSNNIKPQQFFKTLYRILLNTEKGPRLGQYICDIGIKRVKEILTEQI